MFNKEKIPGGKYKPTVLLIIDGWGIAPPSQGNAITNAKTPNFDNYINTYPHGELSAAGESVGLPANEAGNSEVGHLLLGVGRKVYQSLPRINIDIEDDVFADNKAFLAALDHVRKLNSKLHLVGLVSTGTVHSSINHLYALLDFCRRSQLTKVYLHLFTDGRDAPPNKGVEIIQEVEQKLEGYGLGQIATISGRYYGMDRDARWERTQKTYEAMVLGRGIKYPSAVEAVKNSYIKGLTDEFIEPSIIIRDNLTTRLGPLTAKQAGMVDDNDAVIFFNFRIDRPRQLTMAFCLPNFETIKSVDFGYVPHESRKHQAKKESPTFRREKWPKNLFFVTMTEYQKGLPVSAIAYPPPKLPDSLPEVLSKNGLKQLHLAESEKERMVTFYFDGMHEQKFVGEDVEIIPSPKVATYDKKPEMSVFKVVKKFKKLLNQNKYNFVVVNFANPDMVAHSGNLEAAIKAVEITDKAMGELVEAVKAKDGTVFITADHGNCEDLLTFPTASFFVTSSTGTINTEHSNNPVPLIIINNRFAGHASRPLNGNLIDVAPTILATMGIAKPETMNGRNLLEPGNQPTKNSVNKT